MDLHEFCKWIVNFLKPIFQVKKDFYRIFNFFKSIYDKIANKIENN